MDTAALRLPPYFPLKVKKCQDASDSFFDCFDFNSVPNGDKDVGRKALSKCGSQLQAYKACMDEFKSLTDAASRR
ncbi:hypothetical protein HDU83_006167 [Entophlyctis luteolus]|nr:hypothetical protein HDU83_006167 [Entophlyctis luteolus]